LITHIALADNPGQTGSGDQLGGGQGFGR